MKVAGASHHSSDAEGKAGELLARTVEGEVAEIVARCRAHDDAAWRQLYDAHFEFVYRVARRLGTPEEEAEDVAHDVFMIVYRKLDEFEGGRLTTWLYRITAN